MSLIQKSENPKIVKTSLRALMPFFMNIAHLYISHVVL